MSPPSPTVNVKPQQQRSEELSQIEVNNNQRSQHPSGNVTPQDIHTLRHQHNHQVNNQNNNKNSNHNSNQTRKYKNRPPPLQGLIIYHLLNDRDGFFIVIVELVINFIEMP